MRPAKFLRLALLLSSLLFFLIPLPALSLEAPTVSSYLTDKAGIFDSASAAKLEQALRALEVETAGVQYVVYVERALPSGTTLEEYTLAIAEKNKIGRAGRDNGILLYVAIDDRAYRWEVGYGIEGTLSSPLLGRVSRDYLVPNFRNGDYSLGILEATRVVGGLLLNSTDPDIAKLRDEVATAPEFNSIDAIVVIAFFGVIGAALLLFLISVVLSLFVPRDRRKAKGMHNAAATAIFFSSLGRHSRGGGFSGGSFGGFSGGGGSFGGGGFSGRW